MSEKITAKLRAAVRFLRVFAKWLVIASVTGAVGGLIGAAFHLSVDGANGLRASFPWLLWLLPAIGVLIALIRVIGGVHYPSDVLAGAIIGILAGLILYL